MCKSIEGISGRTGKVLDWTRWISQVLVAPVLGLALWGWWNHEERIDAVAVAQEIMSNNRCTAKDCGEIWHEMTKIRADLDHKADASGAAPVLEDLRDHEERLRALERR